MRYKYAYLKRYIRFLAVIIDFVGYGLFAFRKFKAIEPKKIKNILVVRADAIGDNFLMTSFIQTLAKVFNGSKIDVLVGSWGKNIWEDNLYVREILIFNNYRFDPKKPGFKFGQFFQAVKIVKSRGYDIFIDTRGEPISALIGFFAGIQNRIGFVGHEALSFLYTHTADFKRDKNEVYKYEDLLGIFSKNIELNLPKLYPTENEIKKVENIIKDKFQNGKIVALHLTAGGSYKIWPTENFAVLIEKIHKSYPDYNFAILGGSEDLNYYEKIKQRFNFKVESLAGQLSLKESYVFLSHCSLFIGNDSVLVHFSATQGIPTVNLVNKASGGIGRSAALGPKVFPIEGYDASHVCVPRNCVYPCPHMKTIPPEKVFETCVKIIQP